MDLLERIARDVDRVFLRQFAEAAVYTPAGGSARTIKAIFDRQADVQSVSEMLDMDGVAAFANVETAAVPELAIGDAMTVRGQSYIVNGIEPDGTGITIVRLGL